MRVHFHARTHDLFTEVERPRDGGDDDRETERRDRRRIKSLGREGGSFQEGGPGQIDPAAFDPERVFPGTGADRRFTDFACGPAFPLRCLRFRALRHAREHCQQATRPDDAHAAQALFAVLT